MPTPAAAHLRATLVERKKTPRYWLGVAIGLLTQEAPPLFDLVVTRRDTGREVMRTVADIADPAHLLEQVNADLESKTIEEFFSEWRVVE
jgi:hypothetical protein